MCGETYQQSRIKKEKDAWTKEVASSFGIISSEEFCDRLIPNLYVIIDIST